MRITIRLSILISLLASIGLAGCGVRGPLQAPPSEKASAGYVDKTSDTKKGNKGHESFVLDGLLR